MASDGLLSVVEALPYLPPVRRLGRVGPPSPVTVARWIRVGRHGVRLEAERFGQRTYALTRDRCQRFCEAVAARAARRQPQACESNPIRDLAGKKRTVQ
jgi:hypothetical protein